MSEQPKQVTTFAGMPVNVTDDWPKMPEPEEVARWEAERRERLAQEARSRAA
jgi:hypothetical protein